MKKINIIITCIFLSIYSFGQDTKLRFFAQPGLDLLHNPVTGNAGAVFRGAEFVAYITSDITDRLSAAVELHPHVMFKTGPEFEIERLFLKYYIKDYFSLRAGRMFMPIGFWNQNYNFAYVMNPVIHRPNVLQPIHDDGFINTRDVGVQFEGNDIGDIRFSYKAMVSNGVGKNGGLLGNYKNFDTHFAYSANISIQPLDGLRFIASGIFNESHKGDPTQFEGVVFLTKIQKILYNASIVYMNPETKFEFIAEYIGCINRYENPIGNKNLYSGFLYSGYKLSDKIIPYLFAEFTKFNYSDPLYAPITGVDLNNVNDELSFQSNLKFSPGIKYRFSTNAVLKLEYQLNYFDKEKFVHGPSTQFAIGF